MVSLLKKSKKGTLNSQKELLKSHGRASSGDYFIEEDVTDTFEGDHKGRVLGRCSRTGSLDRKKRYNIKLQPEKPRAVNKPPLVKQQDILAVNSAAYPSRKYSMPDGLHKPPSQENDAVTDPLVDKPKQSPASSISSIKPPSALQPPFVLQQQQQQQKVVVTQTKPSPTLLNKKLTAIPRAISAKNHTVQPSGLLELEDHQMSIPKSHSNEELSTLLMSEAGNANEPLSPPPPTIMENQPPDRATFTFPRYSSISLQQMHTLTDQSPKLISPPKLHGQKPSAIPVQHMNLPLNHYNKAPPQQPIVASSLQQALPRGTDKRYSIGSNGSSSGFAPYRTSTSPVPGAPMSPKYPVYQPTSQPLPSKLPVSSTAANVAAINAGVPQGSRQKVVEKAMRARLYLLENPGPNIFLVTGDSNESRFRVTVGPQKCSCNKMGCIHLLFVMLRVLKVTQNDSKLWSKELKNYEVESLLSDYHNRRLMSPNKRGSMKRCKSMPAKHHHYSSTSSTAGSINMSSSEGGSSLQMVLPVSGNINESGLLENKTMTPAGEEDMTQVFNGSASNQQAADVESDDEDEICPICLLEIVEGEDLVECVKGCHIELHRHCMEIWGTEQRRRGDNTVKCPVCITSWDRVPSSSIMHSLSNHAASPFPVTPTHNSSEPDFQDASSNAYNVPSNARSDDATAKPYTSTPVPMMRHRTYSRLDTSSFFLDHFLSEHMMEYLLNLKKYVSTQSLDQIFSSNWKSREAGLQDLARDIVSLLMPSFTHHQPSNAERTHEQLQRSSVVRCALEACCPIIAYSCTDAVLKVYLATLELCRVILCNSLCDCSHMNVEELRIIFKPILSVILVRCADAQSRARECSLDFLHHLCLGQAGPLALSSACGNPSSQEFGGVEFVCALALEQPPAARQSSGHWWLGRLLFLEHALAEFDVHFMSPQSIQNNSAAHSTADDPSDSSLLVKVWEYAAAATHAQHQKVTKVAIRVFKRSIELALDYPALLERTKHIISQCHESVVNTVREVVGKLLAQKGITKPHKKHRKYGINRNSAAFRDKHSANNELELSIPQPDNDYSANDLSRDCSKSLETSSEIEDLSVTQEVAQINSQLNYNEEFVAGNIDVVFQQPVYVESRYNHQRAMRNDSSCSDLDVGSQERRKSQATNRPVTSSNNSSDVPKQTTSESSSCGDHVSSEEHHHISAVMARQFSKEAEKAPDMKRTVKLRPPNDMEDCHCKREVEEEEAMALAQVQSLVEADQPHPPISIAPPSQTVVVHVQPDMDDVVDGGKHTVYRQDNEWVKGKPIGSGAYCSCFLAQDTRTGTIMAVKQVSYIRNTPSEEDEEQKRLIKEVSLMAKLLHPNIVRCLGATQQPGCFNIFLEWMAGGSLERLLHDFGAFHPVVIANYTRQIIFGLAFLHSNGIIHRDLKGANILVDSTGQRIRIADLGAAARLAAQLTEDDEFRNDVQGTVPFMAPEVVRGEHYGRSCDVWSAGCCIIQMATGKPPWNASGSTNKFALIYKIATATESPPMPDGLTVEVRDLGIRCLELKPEDRPKSADLLKHALFRNI